MDKINELIKRIVIDPKVMVGKPVIKGTRLTVEHILGLLAEGMNTQEILQDYTHLKQEDIFACIAFAKEALQSTTFMPLHP
jgi:uncharacterized protein (DUF433 family)